MHFAMCLSFRIIDTTGSFYTGRLKNDSGSYNRSGNIMMASEKK